MTEKEAVASPGENEEKWKRCKENRCRRDKRTADALEEGSYEEDPVVLERKVNAALKVLGRNKSPAVCGIELGEAVEPGAVQVLTEISQLMRQTGR